MLKTLCAIALLLCACGAKVMAASAPMLGIAGVVVMTGSDALSGLGGNVMGQAACLVATLAYAIAGVYSRRFKSMGITPLAVSTGQLTAAALLVLPLAVVFEQPWALPVPPTSAIWGMVGLVVLSTTFAYVLFFRLIETAGASNTLLVTFLIPVTAILLSVFVLGEGIESKHFAGMLLIALGIAAIDGRLFAKFRTDPTERVAPLLRYLPTRSGPSTVITDFARPRQQCGRLRGRTASLIAAVRSGRAYP